MAPKTPDELREQLERENEESAGDGQSRTAEGQVVPDPKRSEFFENLRKAAYPGKDS
jgi:hypothetical protein